jgi:IS66 Orf2 like protein
MLQLTPQSRIFLATHPVDFRKGIDGLCAVCRHTLGENPLEGAVYVFRNRTGTALKLLLYDGQGYWLCAAATISLFSCINDKIRTAVSSWKISSPWAATCSICANTT